MAKYDAMRKLERNIALIQYYKEHPEMSLREIAKIFNITPQRVWELIQNHKGKQQP
jgi:predicted transcriptional regulator